MRPSGISGVPNNWIAKGHDKPCPWGNQMKSLIKAYVDKLPKYDPTWPAEKQRRWMRAYMHVLRLLRRHW